MSNNAYRISASSSVMVEIIALAHNAGAETSAPQPTSSTADPLNAPVTGGDLQAAAEVITVIFSTGTAVIKFFSAVLEIVQKNNARITASRAREKETITIRTQNDIDKIHPLQ